MSNVKSFLNIKEIVFPFFTWLLVFVIYWSFTWFFNEPINPVVYLVPVSFVITLFLAYFLTGKSKDYEEIKLQKNRNFLVPTLIGFSTILIQFYLSLGNIGKNIADIRSEHQENSQVGFQDTLYAFLFPMVIISFILVNFNDLKHKKIINIITFLSCAASIPINGGRINFLVFGSIYLSIYLYKNYNVLRKKKLRNLLKFVFFFIIISIVASLYGLLRTGKDNDELIKYMTTLQHIKNDTLASLLKLPYNFGLVIILFINTFYDYTGGNVYYLSLFIDEFHNIKYRTYGFYNFNFLDRFQFIDWNKAHEDIDKLYLRHDITYNVWASFLRDFSIDFGVYGSFFVLFILGILMFHTKRYLNRSYSAQVLYFLIFAFLIFSPFHSLFFVARTYGIAFFIALFFFIRFRFKNDK